MNPTSVWVLFLGCECGYFHLNPKIQQQSPARWLCVYVPFFQVYCCNCLLQLLATSGTLQCWWTQLSSKVAGWNQFSNRKANWCIHHCAQSWYDSLWSLSWSNMKLFIAISIAMGHVILFCLFTRYHRERVMVHCDLHHKWTLIICTLSCNETRDCSLWPSSRMNFDHLHSLMKSN